MNTNKGLVMSAFMARRRYSKALCAGDDETDENMFRVADERIVSVKVGDGVTAARYRSPDPAAFRTFLEMLLAERGHRTGRSEA